MPAAAPLPIAPDDLAILRRWARASQLPAVLVQRAKILLLAAEGIANTDIADRRVTPGRPEQRTHDYIRHGTTTLFAALEVATGRITDQCQPRHRHQEFLRFLKLVARTTPTSGCM